MRTIKRLIALVLAATVLVGMEVIAYANNTETEGIVMMGAKKYCGKLSDFTDDGTYIYFDFNGCVPSDYTNGTLFDTTDGVDKKQETFYYAYESYSLLLNEVEKGHSYRLEFAPETEADPVKVNFTFNDVCTQFEPSFSAPWENGEQSRTVTTADPKEIIDFSGITVKIYKHELEKTDDALLTVSDYETKFRVWTPLDYSDGFDLISSDSSTALTVGTSVFISKAETPVRINVIDRETQKVTDFIIVQRRSNVEIAYDTLYFRGRLLVHNVSEKKEFFTDLSDTIKESVFNLLLAPVTAVFGTALGSFIVASFVVGIPVESLLFGISSLVQRI